MSHNARRLWLIAYDIQDDKTRREVYALLKNHGERVQFSVFECRLKPLQLEKLRANLVKRIEDGDTIRYYQLCSCCETKVSWQGTGKPIAKKQYYLL